MRLLLLVLSMLPPISANQNRSPAGVLNNGVLTIAIDAREGTWHPDSDKMPGIAAYAFGEAGKTLQIPGPLIRVPAGTKVRRRLTNHIDGKTLRSLLGAKAPSACWLTVMTARARSGTSKRDCPWRCFAKPVNSVLVCRMRGAPLAPGRLIVRAR